MRCIHQVIIAGISITLLAGCGDSKAIPKQYPGGEPGSFAELESETSFPSVDHAEIVPPRTIIIPGNKREEGGLYLDADLAASEVKAGTPAVLQCTIRNKSSNPTAVKYTTSERFDAVVFADPNQVTPLFMWSDTQQFTKFFEERMLAPGVAIPRTLDIPTVKLDDSKDAVSGDLTTPLPPGKYYIWVRHSGLPALSFGPIEFNVVE